MLLPLPLLLAPSWLRTCWSENALSVLPIMSPSAHRLSKTCWSSAPHPSCTCQRVPPSSVASSAGARIEQTKHQGAALKHHLYHMGFLPPPICTQLLGCPSQLNGNSSTHHRLFTLRALVFRERKEGLHMSMLQQQRAEQMEYGHSHSSASSMASME